jgi:hypothetical protein
MHKDSTTKGGDIDLKQLEPSSRRDADMQRQDAEQRAMGIPDARRRRKKGRTEPISIRTHPHIKRMLIAMADAEQCSITEIFEDAVTQRDAAMKGRKPSV